MPRGGVRREDVEGVIDGDITWLDMPGLDVSGTMLRRRVSEGLPIRFLVPDPVLDYVRENRLYVEPA